MNSLQQTLALGVPISWPKWLISTSLFLVLALVLPIGFHQIGMSGRIFLPMHIPPLLAGFLAGPISGIVVGILAPALSHLINGMPPSYAVPLMSVELAVYGLVAGMAFYKLRLNIFIALLTAMIVGRIMFGVTLFFLGLFVEMPYTAAAWFSTAGAMVTGWPGVLVQLAMIPLIVIGAKKSKLV